MIISTKILSHKIKLHKREAVALVVVGHDGGSGEDGGKVVELVAMVLIMLVLVMLVDSVVVVMVEAAVVVVVLTKDLAVVGSGA